MLRQLVVCAKIFAVQERRLEVRHLLFESAGQHRQTHDFDQADVFLLNVVQLLVRMIKPHRVFRRGQVVAQDQIQLILAVPHPGNRCDGVVRLTVRFREDHRVGVRVLAPFRKDSACEVTELLLVRRVQAQHRHRISDHAAVHILKAGHFKTKLFLRLFHRERVVAALEVLMR